MSKASLATIGLFVTTLTLAAGCGGTATAAGPNVPAGYTGAIAGSLDTGSADGDPALRDGIAASAVWCAWHDGAVYLHVRWRSTLTATVQISVTPRYEIDRGGTHGDSTMAIQELTLPAGGVRSWTTNIGAPESVAPETAISKCSPQLVDVSLG